jgi:hypothetical protein
MAASLMLFQVSGYGEQSNSDMQPKQQSSQL